MIFISISFQEIKILKDSHTQLLEIGNHNLSFYHLELTPNVDGFLKSFNFILIFKYISN